jgi:hypothetical protein
MEQPIENTPEIASEPLTKERKKPNISPEDRAKRAERMRDMANKRNELLRKQKAERFNESAEQTPAEPKPKRARKPKAEPTPQPTPPPPVPEPVAPPPPVPVVEAKKSKAKPSKVRKVKTLVIQSSSDSEDYADGDTTGESDDDEPVIYVAKKSRSSKSITKSKQNSYSTFAEPTPQVPAIRVKFF